MKNEYCMKCMQPNGGTAVCPRCGYLAGEETHAPHVLQPGTILDGRYMLGEPLGQGGFGITYIGRDLNLDIRVAVKEYFPSGYAMRNAEASDQVTITDERLRDDVQKGKERFLLEAQTLAQFKNTPGIVDVLNFFKANNTAYIVMEYLDGEPLSRRLRRNLFTADEIFQLMAPVFDTLEKVHQQGVVHRDISPDNIMMMPDGRLKLMDFGAARLMNYTDQRSVSIVLKAGYAPKEQYASKGKQGPWTDVYALCATIYKCITGVTPDDALDRSDKDDLKWPSELGFPISMRQEAALKKGMAVSQKDRFQSIDELRAALEEETTSSAETEHVNTEPGVRPVQTGMLPDDELTVRMDYPNESPAVRETTSTFSAPEKEEAVAEKVEQRMAPKSAKQEEKSQTESFAAEQPVTIETVPSADRNIVKPAKSKQESPWKKIRLLWLLLLGTVLVAGILYLFGVFRLPIQNCSFGSTSSSIPVQSDDGNAISSAKNDDQTTHRANMVMNSGGETSVSFGLGSVLASVINEQSADSLHIDVASNSESDIPNLFGLWRNDCQLAIASYPALMSCYYGDFSTVRILAGLYAQSIQIVTTDPSIKSVTDLKGKRVCVGPIGSGSYFSAYDVFFAFGMDIEKDITPMYMATMDGLDDMKNGLCDVVFVVSAVPNARVFELGDTAHLVSIDDEHLENLLTGWPYYSKMTYVKDVYGTGSDWQTVAVKTVLATNAAISDNAAYNIVKTIFEYKNEITAAHAMGAELDLTCATDGMDIPFHPGAAKYYREKGVDVMTTPSANDIKVGVILDHDENSNATYEQIEGIRTAIRNLGIAEPEWRYNILEIDDEVYNTATELVEQGCNIIFASEFGFETGMVQAAAEHPDVIYVIYEGEQANVCGLSNVVNVTPRIYESRYISGVVAGMKLKELLDMGLIKDPHVGYVGTFGFSYEVSSYTAFFLGVRSIVPNAHMDVMYTESWYDPYRSSAAAQTLMEKGCIIICEGLTRDTGVASAVEEAWKNDKAHFSVGYAEDYSSIAPNSLLTVAQANMSAHYQSVLIDFLNGKMLAHDYALGYEADGVIISGLGLACAPGTAEKVEEVIAAIKAGDLHVFDISTFTVNGSTVNTEIVDFSVTDYATNRKDAGEKLETIFDGYFHESFYRSAPYFSLRIDGITELNSR